MNIADWIDRHAAFSPGKPALRDGRRTLDYRTLADQVARLAGALRDRLEVGPGDRVAVIGFNAPELLVLLFACARIGAIFLPLNWRLAAPEHRYILGDCAPRVLFVRPEFAAQVAAEQAHYAGMPFVGYGAAPDGWLDCDTLMGLATPLAGGAATGGYDSDALICYTSGTTGRPKGAVLTQRALLTNALNSIHMHELVNDDRVLVSLPLFHVGGLNIQALPALHLGATVTLHAAFDPVRTLDAIEQERTTLTVLVPAQLVALVNHPRWAVADLSSLRVITSGSTLVPVPLIEAIHARGITLIQVYGSTETAPIATYQTRRDARAKVGSGGLPGLHCEMRIVDDGGADVLPGTTGEVLIRGGNVMRGYWNNPEATAEALVDGWFHSGDVGHVDEDGYLYIDDRKKDMVISGGENIYPAELENLLAGHPALAEAAVVGRPDPKWGEVPVAVVVLRDGASLTAEAVRGWFDGKLARYKHPREVIFVDALPRNAMGKIQKHTLREQLATSGRAGERAEQHA